MFVVVAGADVRYGMSMRREFGSHLQNITPESELVKLIAPDGLVYFVEVKKDFYGPFLRTGWEEFVDATNIQEGDSVLFVYSGGFGFKARIFNPKGHEKSFFCCQPPTGIFEAVPPTTPCDRVLNGHEAHKANDRPSMNLEDGSAPLSNHVGGPSQPPYILARGATLPTQMEKKVAEKVQSIQSDFPIYVKEMTESSINGSKSSSRGCPVYSLTFCREYASACLPYWKTNIHLEVEGKTEPWRTMFTVRRRERVSGIYSGWEEFVWDNDLKVGDVCLFQAKKKSGRTLMVHVIRRSDI